MRKNSIKNTRINAEVQKELSNIIRGEIKDPRIHPMTSVMAVEVAPDLKTCKAFISVLGSEESKQSTIKGLKSAEGYIRRQRAEVAEFARLERRAIPQDINYADIDGLRLEAREKLEKIRPVSFGQASRISGVSPADIAALMIWLHARGKDGEA